MIAPLAPFWWYVEQVVMVWSAWTIAALKRAAMRENAGASFIVRVKVRVKGDDDGGGVDGDSLSQIDKLFPL